MILKCIANNIDDLNVNKEIKCKLLEDTNGNKAITGLKVGGCYTVYAFGIRHIWSRYYISVDDLYYPVSYPTQYFDVLCNRVSKYWQIFSVPEGGFHSGFRYDYVLSFVEWGRDEYFYEHLVDGYTQNVALFSKYKSLMDLEFLHPEVDQSTISLKFDRWVMCPRCDEAWVESENNGMSICPRCSTYLRNSLYQT